MEKDKESYLSLFNLILSALLVFQTSTLPEFPVKLFRELLNVELLMN